MVTLAIARLLVGGALARLEGRIDVAPFQNITELGDLLGVLKLLR